jgi:short-subunit dehydrogenase
MAEHKKWAMVTGASSGIGAAFARRLAAEGCSLILVARNQNALEGQREELLRNGAPAVEVLVADLSDSIDRSRVGARLEDPHAPVDVLVNNAGIALGRSFLEIPKAELLQQLQINVTAVLLLTHSVLPGMVARGRGDVINVASIAAFTPQSGATYAASKAWVLSFTEGLAMALRGGPVRVQALCPGLIKTDLHRRAGIDLSRVPDSSFLDVDWLVRRSLRDLQRGKVVSVPGAVYRAASWLPRVLPRRGVRMVSRVVERFRNR